GGPRVGPVVISEIQYHPQPGGDEFVELANVSAQSVPLFDPLNPTNGWRLHGVDYTFPSMLTLGSGELVLLVAVDPPVFRARNHVPVGVSVLGPYAGLLQNSGESLELQRPEFFGVDGLAYITVDAVRYNDKAPWPPAADGSGSPLQRLVLTNYGNDPTNWIAATPTPGQSFPGGVAPQITEDPADRTVVQAQTATFS